MAKPFPFRPRKNIQDFVKLTEEWIYKYQNSDDDFDQERIKIRQLYLKNRESLLKSHQGYYVFVSQDQIVPTNLTEVIHTGFKGKNPLKDTWGIWFKVGDELKIRSDALFSRSNLGKKAFLPINFGERGNNNLWFTENNVLVDTGCDITTFNVAILKDIRKIYPNFYTRDDSTLDVIGGSLRVETGEIDIDFCGKEYSLFVNFAQIPYVALIGMDLLNDGNLFYDSNKWISFTRHN